TARGCTFTASSIATASPAPAAGPTRIPLIAMSTPKQARRHGAPICYRHGVDSSWKSKNRAPNVLKAHTQEGRGRKVKSYSAHHYLRVAAKRAARPHQKKAGSILRECEHQAWRCDTAERMRSKRDQRHLRLGGKCAGHKDRLAQRFAQPLQPADQIDGGADGGGINAGRRRGITTQNIAHM